MSIKDLKEGIEKKNILFGVKQALRSSKGRKKPKVFVVKGIREDTVKKLEEAKVKVEKLNKTKEEVTKELNLDFESEVFTLN